MFGGNMNTLEALAMAVAEQRMHIAQLEDDIDILSSKAALYQAKFEMCENVLIETKEALREARSEISSLQSELSKYDPEEQTWE